MNITSDILRKLATLSLTPEQMTGVLEILADGLEKEEKRKKSQADRKQRSRDSHGTVTGQGCDGHKSAEKPLNINDSVTKPVLQNDKAIYTILSKKEVSKKESKITGSRFSLTSLPPEWKSFCKAKRPDLDPEETFDAFMDWWIAQPGSKGVKLDWFATWRTWIRNQKTKTGNYHNAKPPEVRKANVITL